MYNDTKFYKIVRPITKFLFKILFRPEVKGVENIPKEGRILLYSLSNTSLSCS